MKFIALFSRVGLDERYREIGLVETDEPLSAEQDAVSRLDDGQMRAWYDGRIAIKLYKLNDSMNPSHDIIPQEKLNALRDEMDQKYLEEMEEPEGGWPRNSQADRI